MQPAIFLDRDNTLIVNDGDLGDPSAVALMAGVGGGLRRLREAGYRLVIVTNQGGVARGVFTEDDVDAVHQRIASLVDQEAGAPDLIDRFYFCPYHPEAVLADYRRDHPWRKPNPGMLLQAADDMDLDLTVCWMIGDQARDVTAGRMAGCRTVLVNDDPAIRTRAHATVAVSSFDEAVDVILDRNGHGRSATPAAPATDASPAAPSFARARRVEDPTEHFGFFAAQHVRLAQRIDARKPTHDPRGAAADGDVDALTHGRVRGRGTVDVARILPADRRPDHAGQHDRRARLRLDPVPDHLHESLFEGSVGRLRHAGPAPDLDLALARTDQERGQMGRAPHAGDDRRRTHLTSAPRR